MCFSGSVTKIKASGFESDDTSKKPKPPCLPHNDTITWQNNMNQPSWGRDWKTTPLWKNTMLHHHHHHHLWQNDTAALRFFVFLSSQCHWKPHLNRVPHLSRSFQRKKHHIWLLLLHRNQFVQTIKVLLCYTELISSLLHLSPHSFTILDVLSTGWRFNKSLLKAGGW